MNHKVSGKQMYVPKRKSSQITGTMEILKQIIYKTPLKDPLRGLNT